MAGLYVHIPFCKSRCVYCGFFSTTSLRERQRYVDALCQETRLRSGEQGLDLDTIYLGGGTPSQLTIPQLRQLFDTIYKYNKVAADAEVTIEVNPDDVTMDFADGLRLLPVNRVSMGAQTFSDERLRFLHRRHNASQVTTAVNLLRQAGTHNISIDLMYGFPDESLSDWEADISCALALGVEHLSAYCLMIEEGTPLHRLLTEGRIRETDEELERRMYDTLIDRLAAAGYEHYELSNFAHPGFRSRHNSSYWQGIPYIGIGAAAHSYDIRSRSWNIADLRQYIEAMEHGERRFDEELLDPATRYNDTVATALRTREGIPLDQLSSRHRNHCLTAAHRYLDSGLLSLSPEGHRLRLTRQALFVSDMVMADLMLVGE